MKEKNKNFIQCLIQHSLRKGKKNKIYNTLVEVGYELSLIKKMDIDTFFYAVFNLLRPFVEVRNVRVRRTTYFVPFPTTLERQQHIVASWILEVLKTGSHSKPLKKKLKEELIKILLSRGVLIDKKKDLYRKAEKSRSFMHYRWY